jgi:hypothetical protein
VEGTVFTVLMCCSAEVKLYRRTGRRPLDGVICSPQLEGRDAVDPVQFAGGCSSRIRSEADGADASVSPVGDGRSSAEVVSSAAVGRSQALWGPGARRSHHAQLPRRPAPESARSRRATAQCGGRRPKRRTTFSLGTSHQRPALASCRPQAE